MNERSAFVRKIGYLVAVAVLLAPLFWLSQPRTKESEGGKLAQYRRDYGLTQANLGEIDPTSETMKLATLGLGPIAVNMLWEKAAYYKKTEDWTNLSATLEQITRLEPNFPSVWEHQGWNLSYNVAVEFDDYHDRYRWIIKGLNFIREGVGFNERSTRLPWFIGWGICGQKIGRADEVVQYRKLFKEDDDFHKLDDFSRPRSERDNWLVSRWWLEKAERVVEAGNPIKGMVVEAKTNIIKGNSPLIFYSGKPKSVISYAEALEEDGVFGEVAKVAWERGTKGWTEYGNLDLPTLDNGVERLNDYEPLEERIKQMLAELDSLAPGVRERIRAERVAKLSPEDRRIVNLPQPQRTPEEHGQGYSLDLQVTPSHFDVASQAAPANRVRAAQLAKSLTEDQSLADEIDRDRDTTAFVYWRDRCLMEADDETLAARKGVFQAEQAFAGARYEEAGLLYDEAFQAWRKPLDKYTVISRNHVFVNDMYDTIGKYGEYLKQVNKPFPSDFILKDQMLAWQSTNAKAMRGKALPWLDENGVPEVELKAAEPKSAGAKAAEPKSDGSDQPAAQPAPAEGAPEAKSAPSPAANPPAAPAEKPANERMPADEKAASDKPAAEKQPADKPAAESVAPEKGADDKPAPPPAGE